MKRKFNVFREKPHHLAWSRSSFGRVVCQRQIRNRQEVLDFYKMYVVVAQQTAFHIVEFFALWSWRVLLNSKMLLLYGLLPLICGINFSKWQLQVKTFNSMTAITTNVWVILNVALGLYALIWRYWITADFLDKSKCCWVEIIHFI